MIGIVLYLVGWLGSVLLAFEESGSLGQWALLVPVVWLYFVVTRIEKTAKHVAISFAGLGLMLVGIFLLQAPSQTLSFHRSLHSAKGLGRDDKCPLVSWCLGG